MTRVRTKTRSTKIHPYLGIVNRTDEGWSAFHATMDGFVDMYAQRFPSGYAVTRLVFIYDWRRWERTFDAYYSPMGAARLASQFAQAVVQGRVQP